MSRTRTILHSPHHGGAGCPVIFEERICNAIPCPQDCDISPWTPWTACSATCGSGNTHRTRTVRREAAFGGALCPTGEQLIEAAACDAGPCALHCEVGTWSNWTVCSQSCGTGRERRTRHVTSQPAFGGFECPVLTQERECNTQFCGVDCVLSAWTLPTICSQSCGPGATMSQRFVQVHERYGGKPCGNRMRSDSCSLGPCPQHCSTSPWQLWSDCTATCGVGTQTRFRSVLHRAEHGGSVCPSLIERRQCHEADCAMHCAVTHWTPWTPCSLSCAGGTQSRSRSVVDHAHFGGRACPFLADRRGCNTGGCPLDCAVSTWSVPSDCSQSCAEGSQLRTRVVLRAAAMGGRECPALTESAQCNTAPCPMDCTVSQWSTWSVCSKSCGGGTQVRSRQALRHAMHDGFTCPTLLQTTTCSEIPCAVNCVLSAWSPWSLCSQSCTVFSSEAMFTAGTRSRQRHVLRPALNGGRACSAVEESAACNTHPCPIDCRVSLWPAWGACSTTCNEGTKQRARVPVVMAIYGGRRCPALTETAKCNVYGCPTHCEVGAWLEWTACSRSCNRGYRTRSRQIVHVASYGGVRCAVLHEAQACNTQYCPVDCVVSSYSSWSSCSKTCGGGSQARARYALLDVAFGGVGCPSQTDSQACNAAPCAVDCSVSSWQPWGNCSTTCGGGTQRRGRVIVQHTLLGGRGCPALSASARCDTYPCPMHCTVSPWSGWSPCSVSCDGGASVRTRIVLAHAMHGGYVCPSLLEHVACNTKPCAIDCAVGLWSAWKSFYGGGAQVKRTRPVLREAHFGGRSCPALSETKAWHSVYNSMCQQHAISRGSDDQDKFGVWVQGKWSACTKACGSGLRFRYRQHVWCSHRAVLRFHVRFRQSETCHTQECPSGQPAVEKHVEVPPLVVSSQSTAAVAQGLPIGRRRLLLPLNWNWQSS